MAAGDCDCPYGDFVVGIHPPPKVRGDWLWSGKMNKNSHVRQTVCPENGGNREGEECDNYLILVFMVCLVLVRLLRYLIV